MGDDDGDQDDQQVGNGMANGLKLPNGRVIKKAKRQAKATSFSEDGGGVMVAPSPGLVKLNSKAAKNLRRSRATGRGLPKKGGAGKGGWGKLGDEIELPWVDPNDPNYDSIDVPQAYMVLERFVLRCRSAGIINDEVVRKMPSRGRKRFVSEGDGGLVKETSW